MYKKYVLLFFSIQFVLILVYISINLSNTKYIQSATHTIRTYQFKKIERYSNVDTVIIGDSSSGNAIDANYFSLLSNKKTINLSLVGSFGIEGSLNMLKKVKKKLPNIKNVLIVHTLDIWTRDFSRDGYFSTIDNLMQLNKVSYLFKNVYLEYFIYVTNPKVMYWLLRDFIRYLNSKNYYSIDTKNDYLRQDEKTFANGKKKASFKNVLLLKEDIKKNKKEMYLLLDEYCKTNNLNCIYAHGPIHNNVYEQSQDYIKEINTFLIEKSNNVHVKKKVFHYETKNMGDSLDHVDVKMKKHSTQKYFDLFSENLN